MEKIKSWFKVQVSLHLLIHIKVDASMSHSVENGKEVYNFTYGVNNPSENSTAFEHDYNYRGEREVDSHIIHLWEPQ